MSIKNRCYTYFAIDGYFDPDDVSRLLNLTPINVGELGTTAMEQFLRVRVGNLENVQIMIWLSEIK